MEELNYPIPPDILHYESKYMLGFGINDLMFAMLAAMPLMLSVGPIVGLLAGGITLIAMRRYDGLGNRSLITYFAAMLWYRLRPLSVVMPRTLPPGAARLEVHSWEGAPMFVIDKSL